MPTAEMTVSNSRASTVPPISMWAVTLGAARSSAFTVPFSMIVMPCLTNCLRAKAAISASSTGRMRSITSTTVVVAPIVL